MTERDDDFASAVADLEAAGHHCYVHGRFPEAVRAYERAIDLLEGGGRSPSAMLLCQLAGSQLGDSQAEAAEATYRRALELARATADGAGEAAALEGLGFVCQRSGQPERAAVRFRAARDLWRTLSDRLAAGRVGYNLAGARYLASDPAAAADAYREAIDDLCSASAPRAELAASWVSLGGVLYQLGEMTDAIDALVAAEATLPESPRESRLAAALLANRGLARMAVGEFAGALADFTEAKAVYAELGDRAGEARQAAALSNLHRNRDELDLAIAFHREVMRLEAEHGVRVEEPGGLLYTGVLDRALWVDLAAERPDPGPPAEAAPAATPSELAGRAHAHRAEQEQRPFVIFAPPCPGTFGPVFPRGATAVASFLNAHGVPSLVVPLSHYVGRLAGGHRTNQRMAEVIRAVVRTLRPRAVGISVTFTYLYPRGLDIARIVGELDPELPVLFGGPHVTYWDRECLEEAPAVDVVVRGEGEWTALEVLRALESDGDLSAVRGITWRDPDGQIRRNRLRPLGDVLELPEVDFGLLPPEFARHMEVFGISSRGCTFRCRYCHEFRYWGGVVRQYPADRLVAEMERLQLDHQNAMRGIDDSMLNMEEPYFVELIDKLGQSPHLPSRFGLLTRVDTITRGGLQAMRRAGIPSLSVGMESGSDVVLRAMNKGVTVADALVGLERVREAGISLSTFFIVGHPGDNAIESEVTLRFIDRLFQERLTSYVDLSMFTPYPGTPYFHSAEKYGVNILTLDWSRWRRNNRPVSELAEFPANEIYLAYLRTLRVQRGHRGGDRPRPETSG